MTLVESEKKAKSTYLRTLPQYGEEMEDYTLREKYLRIASISYGEKMGRLFSLY